MVDTPTSGKGTDPAAAHAAGGAGDVPDDSRAARDSLPSRREMRKAREAGLATGSIPVVRRTEDGWTVAERPLSAEEISAAEAAAGAEEEARNSAGGAEPGDASASDTDASEAAAQSSAKHHERNRPVTEEEAKANAKDYGKAGRNLPAAIGVGVGLGGIVLLPLIFFPPLFVLIVLAGVIAAVWELSNALSRSGSVVSRPPTIAAAACMVVATYFGGREALWVAFTVGTGAVLLVNLLENRKNPVKDVCLSLFALTYVGLMASFVVSMLTQDHGNYLVIMFLSLVVSSDTGGYIAGVMFGKHPIAPRISPKKSWEGYAGSAVLAMLVGTLIAVFLIGAPFWTGLLMGLVIPAFATLGDFSESMIKRDLGLKDMGTLLPGHGGVMDRLDSILPTAPVALLFFSFLPGYIS